MLKSWRKINIPTCSHFPFCVNNVVDDVQPANSDPWSSARREKKAVVAVKVPKSRRTLHQGTALDLPSSHVAPTRKDTGVQLVPQGDLVQVGSDDAA